MLGYDKKLCSEVLRAFTGEVQRSLRRRAKLALGLDSVELAHTAGITFIQRFDSALRLNVHFLSLFLDGVYVERNDGSLEFVELAEPTPEQSRRRELLVTAPAPSSSTPWASLRVSAP